MPDYTLYVSPAARKDLRDIYQTGLRNWGITRSSKYLEDLKEVFWTLTSQPFIGVERLNLSLEMRSFQVGSHVVFYRTREQRLEIIRILHGRQDPNRHIKGE